MVAVNNVSQHLKQTVSVEFGTAIMQAILQAQAFQSLQEWPQQDTPDTFTIVIHTDSRQASAHARKYKTQGSSEVAAIFVRVKDGEVDTSDILLRGRGAIS